MGEPLLRRGQDPNGISSLLATLLVARLSLFKLALLNPREVPLIYALTRLVATAAAPGKANVVMEARPCWRHPPTNIVMCRRFYAFYGGTNKECIKLFSSLLVCSNDKAQYFRFTRTEQFSGGCQLPQGDPSWLPCVPAELAIKKLATGMEVGHCS